MWFIVYINFVLNFTSLSCRGFIVHIKNTPSICKCFEKEKGVVFVENRTNKLHALKGEPSNKIDS